MDKKFPLDTILSNLSKFLAHSRSSFNDVDDAALLYEMNVRPFGSDANLGSTTVWHKISWSAARCSSVQPTFIASPHSVTNFLAMTSNRCSGGLEMSGEALFLSRCLPPPRRLPGAPPTLPIPMKEVVSLLVAKNWKILGCCIRLRKTCRAGFRPSVFPIRLATA